MNSPDQVAERLRARGMKVTAQRMAICAWLHGNTSHPTAVEIFAALLPRNAGLSLSTVYATLDALESIGELRSLELHGTERRFDPLTTRHDHAVCRVCGTVRDVPAGAAAPERPRPVPGFLVEDHHIVFSGVCAGCRAAATAGRRPRSRSRSPNPPRRRLR